MTAAERISELESRIAAVEAKLELLAGMLGGRATPKVPGANRGPTPERKAKWLDKARFASKCATERCSNRVEEGARAYYEPANEQHKARVFCVPCGEALTTPTP